jgi:hypothetical protein
VTFEVTGLPRQLTLAAGGRLEIPLPSYAGSGNAWSASCLSGPDVAGVSVALGPPVPPAPVPGSGPPQPRLATEHAVVRGLRAGTARWRLELARSFGPRQPVATVDIDITVTPADPDRPR